MRGVVFTDFLLASAPLQAYLFAALLSSFSIAAQYLIMLTNFWCLMFVVLAGCVGLGYFALSFASTRIAFVSKALTRGSSQTLTK
jgi:hypothetical protein